MRAIDTNIVLRLLTADDPDQSAAARRVVEAGEIFVGSTVLLESEWVLRAAYRFSAAQIAAGLRGLAGLPGVTIEEPVMTAQALAWMEDAGLDFADALHLARASHCSSFITFDRKLAKRATGLSTIPVVIP